MRIIVGIERFPPGKRGFPLRALGRMRATHAIFEGLFIRRNKTGARATLDRHVADGHAAFHAEVANGLATIFDHIAGATGRAGHTNHREGDILGRHTGAQLAGDLDLHVLALALDQRLGRQNMLNLGRADAMGQSAERAMGGGVAVAADHGHARQGPALLGADDMHDALAHVRHRIIVNAEILGVLVKRLNLNAAVFGHGGGIGTVKRGGHVVVRHGNGLFGRAYRAFGHAQPFKGLRAGDLMHKMAVDIKQAGAIVGLVGDMGIPDFIIKRLGGHVSSPVL